MPAVDDRLQHTASAEFERGLWMLGAGVGAIADHDGSTTLLLPEGGRELHEMVTGLADEPGYLGQHTVGVDATGVVVPLKVPRRGDELPATMRIVQIIVFYDAAGSGYPPRSSFGLDGLLCALVDASVGLEDLHRPLARMAELVVSCEVALVPVEAPISAGDLRLMSEQHPLALGAETVANSTTCGGANGHHSWTHQEPSVAHSPMFYRGTALDALEVGRGRLAVLLARSRAVTLHMLDDDAVAIWCGADGVPRSMLGGSDARLDHMLAAGLLGEIPSWRIADDVAWVSQSTTTTVLGPRDGVPLALAGSSHVIWTELVERRATRQDTLGRSVAEFFAMPADEIADSIDDLLQDLRARGLVTRI